MTEPRTYGEDELQYVFANNAQLMAAADALHVSSGAIAAFLMKEIDDRAHRNPVATAGQNFLEYVIANSDTIAQISDVLAGIETVPFPFLGVE